MFLPDRVQENNLQVRVQNVKVQEGSKSITLSNLCCLSKP